MRAVPMEASQTMVARSKSVSFCHGGRRVVEALQAGTPGRALTVVVRYDPFTVWQVSEVVSV